MKFAFITTSLFLAAAAMAWSPMPDDQSLMTPEQKIKFNPAPVVRNFLKNNSSHKILMGVIDNGFDYNHPLLLNSWHFDLDSRSQPTGLGYDFATQDQWPYYALASTALNNPQTPPLFKHKVQNAKKLINDLFVIMPELKKWIDPDRSMNQEFNLAVYHGTHVAGLMVKDNSQIGLIPFRTNTGTQDDEEWFSNIAQSIDLAVQKGAKIINMSFGLKIKGHKLPAYSKIFSDAIARYPKILFVAAAGNDGEVVDGQLSFTMPCNYKLDNLICVGAVDHHDNPAMITNIIRNGSSFIFVRGVNVHSTAPISLCMANSLEVQTNQLSARSSVQDPALIEGMKNVLNFCDTWKGMYSTTGTSMAAPILARYAAELLLKNPSLAPKDIIKTIFQNSVEIQHKGKIEKLLKITDPDWIK